MQTGKDILIRFPRKVARSFMFLKEFKTFRLQNDGRFPLRWKDAYPCLNDAVKTTPFDRHYIYHPAWAARKIREIRPREHVDISSILSFSTIVSAFTPVRFYDYRPAEIKLPGLQTGAQDLTKLSFEDGSIESLSCMHTVEHIGLGRYGDELDAKGDIKAINELKRVLKKGGHLLFVTPVGEPKIAFNAHRIYSYGQIVDGFRPLALKEFSMVTDDGRFLENCDETLVAKQTYACGCFWFKNEEA